MSALTANQRKELIDDLVANCGCENQVWNEDDRELLEDMIDDKLVALHKRHQALAANEAALVANQFGDDDDEDETDEEEEKTVENQNKPVTLQEWMDQAPPEVQVVVRNAQRHDATVKAELIQQITSNANNPYSKEQLTAMTTEQLAPLAKLAGSAPAAAPAYYGGAAAPAMALNQEDANDFLPLPTMTFEKQAG